MPLIHNGVVPVTDAMLELMLVVTVTAVLVAEGHEVPLPDHVIITWPLPD